IDDAWRFGALLIDPFTIDPFTIDPFTIDPFTIDPFTIERGGRCLPIDLPHAKYDSRTYVRLQVVPRVLWSGRRDERAQRTLVSGSGRRVGLAHDYLKRLLSRSRIRRQSPKRVLQPGSDRSGGRTGS